MQYRGTNGPAVIAYLLRFRSVALPQRNSDWDDDDDDDRPRRRSRRRDDDDDDDDDDEEVERPRKRWRRRKPPPKSGFPVAVVLLLGGGLVLGVVGVVILVMFQNKGGGPGPNANGVVNNNPLGLPAVGPPPVVRPPLPPGWVDFKHPDCKASIHCPDPMFPDQSNSIEPFGTPLASTDRRISKGFHTMGPSFTCELLVSEHHPQLTAEERLLIQKQWAVYGKHPVFVTNVIWGGHAGRQTSGAKGDAPGTLVVSRRVWVGNRFYMATISGTFGHPTAAEQAAFFDSFVLGE